MYSVLYMGGQVHSTIVHTRSKLQLWQVSLTSGSLEDSSMSNTSLMSAIFSTSV